MKNHDIKIHYDGEYPCLCMGHLVVEVDDKYWDFGNYSTAMVFGWRLDEIKYKFKAGDIAVLKNDTVFKRGNGVCLIAAGTSVEITNSFDLCGIDLYEIKFQDAMSVVKGYDLDHAKSSERRVEYKFKVGDKVTVENFDNLIFEVVKQKEVDGIPAYEIKHNDLISSYYKECVHPYIPQDITNRIKTFEDAYEWCEYNDKENLVLAYNEIYECLNDMADMQDVFAYLKLRIITAALNEGWEPTMGKLDDRYFPLFKLDANWSENTKLELVYVGESSKLCFKSKDLALYAATQFKDIYLDLYGNEGSKK